jgi:hypothetical protein
MDKTHLSDAEIAAIRRGWEERRPMAEIGRKVGRPPNTVRDYYARFDAECYEKPKTRKPARPNLYVTDFLPS